MNLSSITIDLEKNKNGTLNVWITKGNSSGLNYNEVTPEKIGRIIENEIKEILTKE